MLMKKMNVTAILFSIFSIIGIILLVSSFFVFHSFSKFQKNAEKIQGKIVDIQDYYDSDREMHHRVYVTYSYNGNTYENVPINSYSSTMYVGQEITLLCDLDNPQRIMTDFALQIPGIILMAIGAVFALVGVIPLCVMAKKNVNRKKLIAGGNVIHATVDNIQLNTSYSVNGRHPYVVYCSYKDEYKDVTYLFKSENLWTDPHAVFSEGSYIDVFVDRNDYSKYYVNAQQVISKKVIDYT